MEHLPCLGSKSLSRILGCLPILARYPSGQAILGVEICGTSPVSGVEVLEPNSGLLNNCGKIPVGSTNVAVEHLPCLGSKSLSWILHCILYPTGKAWKVNTTLFTWLPEQAGRPSCSSGTFAIICDGKMHSCHVKKKDLFPTATLARKAYSVVATGRTLYLPGTTMEYLPGNPKFNFKPFLFDQFQ